MATGVADENVKMTVQNLLQMPSRTKHASHADPDALGTDK